jgi:tripartite motif-containing protein 71
VPVKPDVEALGHEVADRGNDRIQKFTSTGTYLCQWGTLGAWVATDAAGNVYVTQQYYNRWRPLAILACGRAC